MTLHHLFEQKALIYHDRSAVVFLDRQYTYERLNAWANQTARFLQERYGLCIGDRVIMFLPKCADQVAILLALSKLGVIYVPLNPNPRDCPDERFISIFNSTAAKCVIASETREVMSTLPVIQLVELNASLDAYSEENLDIPVSENDIAYMIYTSGSTNAPKGVPIKHSGLNYWFTVMSSMFQSTLAYEKKVMSFCLASFDASIWEYLMAWIDGSPLYILDEFTRDNTSQLRDFIEKNAITHATLIPSVMRHIVPSGLPSSLQVVCSTGEACTRDIVEAFERDNKKLFNCYGATEETFGLSVQECSLSLFDEQKGAPIAYPVGDEIEVYIFDENMNESEYGELYVQSPYLTSGYWQQEDETDKNFIVWNDKRLYKSGDFFYRDPINNIFRCIGRINSDAVKIRGAFVSVLEVESYLLKLPTVVDACVVACKRSPSQDDCFLVANLQVSDDSTLSTQKIREYLLKKLAPTSVPAQFLMTKNPLPITANSKKDRQKIQQDYYNSHTSVEAVGDFLPIERELLEILSTVLKVEKNAIRISDTFFTLGGDSISRLVLVDKIKSVFDVELSIQDLYRVDLTFSALVDLIHNYRWQNSPEFPVSAIINPGEGDQSRTQMVFMLHPITGEATKTYYEFSKCLAAQQGAPNLRIYGINARGLQNSFDISLNIDLIAYDYMRAIQKKQSHGPYLMVGWSFGGVLAWKITELLEQKGETVKLVLMDSDCPLLAQQSKPEVYTEALLELIERLNRPLSLSGTVSHMRESLLTLPSKQQIQVLFNYMIETHTTRSRQLELIAALLLANHACLPKNIATVPYLFTCSASQNNAQKSLSTNDIYLSSTLGWSSVSSITLPRPTSASNHFDFIEDHDVMQYITKIMLDFFFDYKEAQPKIAHSSDHETLLSLQAHLAWLTDFIVKEVVARGGSYEPPPVYVHPDSNFLMYPNPYNENKHQSYSEDGNLKKNIT